MSGVKSGDRVQIRCHSADIDGTSKEVHAEDAPYWIRAGAATGMAMVSPALVGMHVGERKVVVLKPDLKPENTYLVEVLAIKAPRPTLRN